VNSIRRRSLAILALLPGFAFVFWMTALLASNVSSLLILGANVHGLSLASYASDAAPRPAPLALRVIEDARQDAGAAATASPIPTAPSAAPSGAVKPTPSVPAPTPSPTPTPTIPLPTPSPVATPTPLPTPLPTLTPLPSLLPSPLPLPLPVVP
jgi:hypothetical protein